MSTRSIIKRSNGDLNLAKGFSELEDQIWNRYLTNPFTETYSRFTPNVDITEDEKNIYVSAEIPGAEKKDIKVSINEGMLTISGEKKKEKEENRKNYYRLERSEGEFTRSFLLPAEVKTENIKAEFKNGILNIELPKNAEIQQNGKQIQIM